MAATALFGGGKTLTSTVYVRKIFKRYDGRKVYNSKTNEFVKQRIIIHSNVELKDVDYVPLKSTQEIIDVSDNFSESNFMDVHLFLIDEASTQFNSRQFKKNFDNPDLLNTILTCRHVKISIILTSQRFNHMDALMRQVTSTVKECAHFWRLYKISYYDAWTIENTANITNVKPLYTKTCFIKDSDFSAYDTFAIVDNLVKSQKNDDMETPEEILSKRQLNILDDPRVNYKRSVNRRVNK